MIITIIIISHSLEIKNNREVLHSYVVVFNLFSYSICRLGLETFSDSMQIWESLGFHWYHYWSKGQNSTVDKTFWVCLSSDSRKQASLHYIGLYHPAWPLLIHQAISQMMRKIKSALEGRCFGTSEIIQKNVLQVSKVIV